MPNADSAFNVQPESRRIARRPPLLSQSPRFIVVQMGARHNYAVPAAFEQYGLLEALYTDLCGTRGIGRIAAPLARLGLPGSAQLGALGARRPPAAVTERTRTFDWLGLRFGLTRPIGSVVSHGPVEQRHRELGQLFGKAMVKAGYASATHVYSMLGEGGPFLIEAKRRGMRVVSDVFIALSADNIVRAEMRAFRGWCADPPCGSLNSQPVQPSNDTMLATSDMFVCPSEFVRDDLIAAAGVAAEKTVVVPYMVGSQWLTLHNRPEPGRILFVGTADLRKGIQYLAIASERLNAHSGRYSFRIAGHVAPQVADQSVCRNLRFLGRIPRTQIYQEFAAADILVLPSLAEGSAGVTYEALGAGVPVVTTKAAGSVVRNGIDGLIVPERDPGALAKAIQSIVEDRAKRHRMALAARERALEFNLAKFADRLVAATCQG